MKARPRLLDLFCGAGGAATGYHRAGFDVVGVDIKPQPRYPFEFIQADAVRVAAGEIDERMAHFALWDGFAAIHASPPCQAFTSLRWMHNAKENPELVDPVRQLLNATGLPYVIENVRGAKLNATVRLCGSSFDLVTDTAELRRHRYFETNWTVGFVPPCRHGLRERVIGVYGGHGRDRRRTVNTQDFSTDDRRVAMGIDWMTGAELSEAIPPAYTEWIGARLLAVAA